VTSQTAHTKYKWLPYAAEWNPPMKSFCVRHWLGPCLAPPWCWTSRIFEIAENCWVRVASSTWNVLRFWNTSKDFNCFWIRSRKKLRSLSTMSWMNMGTSQVASPKGLNFQRIKLEQDNNKKHSVTRAL